MIWRPEIIALWDVSGETSDGNPKWHRERETVEKRLLNHVHKFNKKEDKAVFTLGVHPQHILRNTKTPVCMFFFQTSGRRNYSECDLWNASAAQWSIQHPTSDSLSPLSWGAQSHSTQNLCDPGTTVPKKRKWACLLVFLMLHLLWGMIWWHHSPAFINDTWNVLDHYTQRSSSQTAK